MSFLLHNISNRKIVMVALDSIVLFYTTKAQTTVNT
jgi:hypothetical protein